MREVGETLHDNTRCKITTQNLTGFKKSSGLAVVKFGMAFAKKKKKKILYIYVRVFE